MPTSLPQAAIALSFDDVKNREPSYVALFLSVALAIIAPPLLLVTVAAAIIGHGEVSLATVGTVIEAAGRVEACVEAHDCRTTKAP